MRILIVTYDLKAVKDYTPFYETLKAQGTWWHYLTSTWLLYTDKTPQQVSDALSSHKAPQDLILIAEMGPHYQGFLPKEAWEWISTRMIGVLNPALPFLPVPSPQPVPEKK